ncbi:GL22517 [Drosophila persimilis]|uniref:GL22517 n=1 Tax=Drosophila persimilis TaxID=7234 RepID=B4H1A2_DROPE|nr:GL22517 [Drosophila persimilis]
MAARHAAALLGLCNPHVTGFDWAIVLMPQNELQPKEEPTSYCLVGIAEYVPCPVARVRVQVLPVENL